MELGHQGLLGDNIVALKVIPDAPNGELFESASENGDAAENCFSKKRLVTIIIDHRQLVRECLLRGLLDLRLKGSIECFASVKDWFECHPAAEDGTLVLLSAGDHSPSVLKREWARIVAELGRSVPVVLLAEEEKATYIIDAINDGVRGYIPTSLPLSIAIEAIELVRAGGTFIPARSFLPGSTVPCTPDGTPGWAVFTGRQAEVVAALRRGTSNKIIAHDLNMAESTVKVHVRNIMRKLKARNRTHVAFLLTQSDSTRW